MTRLEANRAIMNKLMEEIEAQPQLRFKQLLASMGLIVPTRDEFYEESIETLAKILEER